LPGPPPEHPHLRLLKGNPGKRPARKPVEPARTEQCPEPPEHLTGHAREAWIHLAPELHKLNLLTILDIGPFSAYCCAYAHWQEAEEALQRSGELTIKTAEGHPRVTTRWCGSHRKPWRTCGGLALSSACRRTRGYG
jgi:P27 family predicted phage terminase small subunit